MNDTVAVLVTYNRLDMLKSCIDHVIKQSATCDILIIDNASTDNTERWVKQQSNIRYYNTGTNLGGAGGFNLGIKKAVQSGYKYLWIMDDDCLPKPDALEKLIEAHKILDGNYGWLSSIALWTDGHECKMNRQKLKKSFYEYSEYLKYGLVQAEQATFVSLFLCSEIISKVGLPIKEFFIWGDDIEYTRRISIREKYPCFVVGASQVVHAMVHNNGSSIATDDVERLDRYVYAFRNENYLYRKEGITGVLFFFAKCASNFLKIVKKTQNYRFKRIRILITGMLKGFFFNPKIELINKSIRERRKCQ